MKFLTVVVVIVLVLMNPPTIPVWIIISLRIQYTIHRILLVDFNIFDLQGDELENKIITKRPLVRRSIIVISILFILLLLLFGIIIPNCIYCNNMHHSRFLNHSP